MRKKEVVRVPEGYGRDVGKHYKITEWPAIKAEKWAWRMGMCLKGTSGYIPEELMRLGILAVTRAIVNGFLGAEVDETRFLPLLDEMMECVQIVRVKDTPDPNDPGMPLSTPMNLDDDIEEPKTVAWIRSEVLRVHTGFNLAERLSKWLSADGNTQEASSITPTYPPQ